MKNDPIKTDFKTRSMTSMAAGGSLGARTSLGRDPSHGRPLPSRAKRRIPKSSKGHFVGELVFNRGEVTQRLGFASMTEHNTAVCFIYRSDFLDIEEQLEALPFVLPNGKASVHYFDFRVTFRGGRRVCISVKPERIAQTYLYRATMDRIKLAAIGNICDDALTVTERNINPIELHNAKLFHSARNPEPTLDAHVLAGLTTVEAPVSITAFLAGIGLGGAGFRSVARAIRFGQARLFNHEKITGRTLIIRGDVS
ncbi:hypothetical protein [Pseudooceanicola algae]|uniref:TnsA endonuclease N-terminal domain-containing protein n=1 Tax=Pseudooceanicola algae TaxID=1537215 RepID=A0A418SL83_9RHOB|nr:hypothetical protein [Pseudooceanicola algae]QPM92024.1 hypothetical protein PSAL_032870 [Pseudooceanicola algae]